MLAAGDNWLARVLDVAIKFRRYARDAASIALILLALLTLLALIGLTSGVWITPWADLLRRWFGWGSIFFVAACGAAGLLLIRKNREPFTARDWGKVIWLELSAFSVMALLAILGGMSIERAELGLDGGVVGWGIAEFFGVILGALPPGLAGGVRVLILLLIAAFGILFGFSLMGRTIRKLEDLLEGAEKVSVEQFDTEPAVIVGDEALAEAPSKARNNNKKVVLPPEYRKKFKIEETELEKMAVSHERDNRLPPIEILESGSNIKPSERHINQTAGLIEKTLAEFGIPAKVSARFVYLFILFGALIAEAALRNLTAYAEIAARFNLLGGF